MCALFGLGRHPNDRAIIRQLAREGASRRVQDAATKLGHAYHLYEPSDVPRRARRAVPRVQHGPRCARDAAIPDAVRARIRSELGREWFRTEHQRDPLDAREFTGYLARISRPAPMPVAGYDLTFSPVKSVSALWAIAPRELAASDRRVSRRGGAGHDRMAGEARRLHPPRHRRRRPGRHDRADRGRVHPPRLARRRPGPAHPRRGQQQGLHPGRAVAVAGRTGAVPEQGRRVRALQHPPRSAADRTGRGAVRRARRRGRRQARGPRDRRTATRVAARLVVAPGRHRDGTRGPDAALPGRARSPTDHDRAGGAGPAGDALDAGPEARTAVGGRATAHLASGSRRGPPWRRTRSKPSYGGSPATRRLRLRSTWTSSPRP